MVLRCQAVSTPSYPLVANEVGERFRLYANDTGLLMAMYDFDLKRAIVENTLVGPMKGGLYETLVAVMLAAQGVPPRYWTSANGSHEIEFLRSRGARGARRDQGLARIDRPSPGPFPQTCVLLQAIVIR